GVLPPSRAAYLGSLDSSERKVLLNSDAKVLYAPPGYLLFVRGTTLTAQGFDTARGQTLGDPFPVADNVRTATNAESAFSASSNGILTYRTGASQGNGDLSWFDRRGHLISKVGDPGNYQGVALSPDAKQLAVHRHESGAGDIWLMDLVRGPMSRFTFDAS